MAEPSGQTTPTGDDARARCYALVSRLFYAPPDAALLAALASGTDAPVRESGGTGSADAPQSYGEAFAALQQASRGANPDDVRQEFDDLFVGAGKAPITPYTSAYAAPSAPDRHLVELRDKLAAWGLARRNAVFEVEDHVSALCDVMRWLIERDHALDEQRAFFDEYVYPGIGPLCDLIGAHPAASYYSAVARMTRAFVAVESEAFVLGAWE